MEEILFWNNGLFRQPYWYIFLYSKLMVNHPDAGETNMTYDAAGNLLTKLTAELRKSISDKGYISYTYDFERLHEVLYPENLFNRVTYTYGKAGYGYIPNDTTKEETFFYHSDHLGSTSYITDDKANITQYDAYLPYGELLVDEHSSSEDLPYKFNGKQFDEETGLYYYGARCMNPKTSLWYGVDPLAEKFPSISTLSYCFDNPIKYIDPDGRKTQYATLKEIVTYGKKNSSTFFSLMKLANINMSNFSKEISFGDETSTTPSTGRICLTKSTDIKRQIIKLTHEFTNRINRLRLQKATEDVKEGIITPKKYAEELIRIEFEGQINQIKVASEIDYRYPKNEDGGTNRLIDRYSIDKSIKLREELEPSKELKQFYIKQGDALRNETRRNQRHKQQFKRR